MVIPYLARDGGGPSVGTGIRRRDLEFDAVRRGPFDDHLVHTGRHTADEIGLVQRDRVSVRVKFRRTRAARHRGIHRGVERGDGDGELGCALRIHDHDRVVVKFLDGERIADSLALAVRSGLHRCRDAVLALERPLDGFRERRGIIEGRVSALHREDGRRHGARPVDGIIGILVRGDGEFRLIHGHGRRRALDDVEVRVDDVCLRVLIGPRLRGDKSVCIDEPFPVRGEDVEVGESAVDADILLTLRRSFHLGEGAVRILDVESVRRERQLGAASERLIPLRRQDVSVAVRIHEYIIAAQLICEAEKRAAGVAVSGFDAPGRAISDTHSRARGIDRARTLHGVAV